jgi:hypothetical protein
MSRQRLSDRLSTRSPLAKREAVTPVNMYERPQVDKPGSREVGKPTSGEASTPTQGQAYKPTIQLADKSTSRQISKTANPPVEKYTTHLRSETIKAIKWAALDNDCKDYEIVQRALDAYLRGERRD